MADMTLDQLNETIGDYEMQERQLEADLLTYQQRFTQDVADGILTLLPNSQDAEHPKDGLQINGKILSKRTKELVQLYADQAQKQNLLNKQKPSGEDGEKPQSTKQLEADLQDLKEKIDHKKAEYQSILYEFLGYFDSLAAIGVMEELYLKKPKPKWDALIRFCVDYYSVRVEQEWKYNIIQKELQYLQESKNDLEHKQQKR